MQVQAIALNQVLEEDNISVLHRVCCIIESLMYYVKFDVLHRV